MDIVDDLGIRLGALDESARQLVLAASILSILVNPLLFAVPDRLLPRLRRRPSLAVAPTAVPDDAPLGIVRYTVTAVDPQGRTGEWKPFDVEASQLTIVGD